MGKGGGGGEEEEREGVGTWEKGIAYIEGYRLF